jgi:adenosylcobinamide-phosphate synthase
MGALLRVGQRRFTQGSRSRLRVAGGVLVVGVALVAGVAAWAVTDLTRTLGLLGLVVEGIALKLMFAVRGLARASLAVARDLERGDLRSARAGVGANLVSRPTSTLSTAAVASAAIESAAENLTDSVVAPLLFYAAFGLTGAAAYRAVNTADAMIGYRRGVLEDFGKVAARLDDVLNFIPARVAALLLAIAALLTRASPIGALTAMWRQHARTASPNAGWTMAAMAGALGVTLAKEDHYSLGTGRRPAPRDVRRSVRVMVVAAALCGLVALMTVVISQL